VTRPDDLPARDLSQRDLPERDLPDRIARLERLLDELEGARHAASGTRTTHEKPEPTALDRLRAVAALLAQRAAYAECDDGDAIAMRALLEEFRCVTTSLREMAADLASRLGAVAGAVDDSHARLAALEEIG
jgi:hypothetical protein